MKIALCTFVLVISTITAFQCEYNITRELSATLSHLYYNDSLLSSIDTMSYVFNDYTLNINSIYLFDYNINTIPSVTSYNGDDDGEKRVDLSYSALVTASISITNYIESIYTLNTVDFMYSFSLSNVGISKHNDTTCTLLLNNDYTVTNITQFPNTQFHNLRFFTELQSHLNSSLPYETNKYIINTVNSTLQGVNVLLSEYIDILNTIQHDYTDKKVYININEQYSMAVKLLTIYDLTFDYYKTVIHSANSIEIYDINISMNYIVETFNVGEDTEGCKVNIEKIIITNVNEIEFGERKWEFDYKNNILLREQNFDIFIIEVLNEYFSNYKHLY